jgi:DNA-binding NarL/FixJ family response regulator
VNGARVGRRTEFDSPADQTIKVLVVDPHPLVRRGMVSLFEADSGLEVVAECSTADEALDAIREHAPDVAVLELRLPGSNTLELIEELKEPSCKVVPVILTSELTEDEFIRARELGVRGIVLKSMPPHLLVQCIRTVHAGGEFLEKNVLVRALSTLMRRAATANGFSGLLTARERSVVELIGRGLCNRSIANELGITEGTVKTHLHRIFEKLDVNSRLELMRLVQGGAGTRR